MLILSIKDPGMPCSVSLIALRSKSHRLQIQMPDTIVAFRSAVFIAVQGWGFKPHFFSNLRLLLCLCHVMFLPAEEKPYHLLGHRANISSKWWRFCPHSVLQQNNLIFSVSCFLVAAEGLRCTENCLYSLLAFFHCPRGWLLSPILLSLAAAHTFPVVIGMSSREGLLDADMVLDSCIPTQNSLEN